MYLNKENKSQRTKNTLLQAATSQPTKQSLQESIFSSTQEKLKNKKFPSLQKNKTSQPHNLRQTGTLTGYSIVQMDGLTGQGRRRASANRQFCNSRGFLQFLNIYAFYFHLCFYLKFVLFNPCHRKAAMALAANLTDDIQHKSNIKCK